MSHALATAADADPVAWVRDLRVHFTNGRRHVAALRGVSLELRRGEVVGLVGESGSGKSVLGLSLLGLLPESAAVAGDVVVDGVDMRRDTTHRREARRKSIAAVFQDPMTSLDATMRIGRQVRAAVDTDDAVSQALQAVAIHDVEHRALAFPHQLSGGLRQRVVIAMAASRSPKVLVADEPTTALDVTVQAQILLLLDSLRRDHGCGLLLITHDLGVAAEIADRLVVMYRGTIVEQGPTADVLARPAHPYTQHLVANRLLIGRALAPQVTSDDPSPGTAVDEIDGSCVFIGRCAHRVDACAVAPAPTIDGQRLVACHRHPIGHRQPPVVDEGSPVRVRSGSSRVAATLDDIRVTFASGRGRRRRTIDAIRGVSLELRRGECLALVGESGSGKTTALRAVAGLLPAGVMAGRITVPEGRPQVVFQDAGSSLTPWMTVGQLLHDRLVGAGVHRDRHDALIAAALKETGLPDNVLSARPRELSGGQRQRAALARAVIVPPPLLLCDEPTSALDASLVTNVLALLDRIRCDLDIATMIVTHDLGVASALADEVAVMYLGRIVERGRTEDVLGAPQHPYTQSLLASLPGTGLPLRPPSGEPPSAVSDIVGCAYRNRCPHAIAACASRVAHLVDLDGHLADCELVGAG